MMRRDALVRRVRSYTRDFSNTLFKELDITDFIDEGIDRFASYIPELRGMIYLDVNESVPILLPTPYHYLLSVFSSARCFAQDERHHQAATLMNEFETKLDELKSLIDSGEITITNPDGSIVPSPIVEDSVTNVYFEPLADDSDVDEGVEGVM